MNKIASYTMQKFKKIILALGISTLMLSALPLAGMEAQIVHADSDLCSEYTGGIIQCPTDEISFTRYTGELVKISPDGYDSGITRTGNLREFIQKIINYALSFLGLAAVILIIYAGVMYMTAGSTTENADKAKKTIGYTVAGLLLIMASYAIVNTVLTGPFEGEDATEGAVGGLAAQGFNANVEEIIDAAEELIVGYKALLDANETITKLQADLKKESLGGSDLLAVPKVSRPVVLQYLNQAKIQLQNLKYNLPTFSRVPAKINTIITYIEGRIDEIQGLNRNGYFKGDGVTVYEEFADDIWGFIPNPNDLSKADVVPTKEASQDAEGNANNDGFLNLYEIWRATRSDLAHEMDSGQNLTFILVEMKKEFAANTTTVVIGGQTEGSKVSVEIIEDLEAATCLDSNGVLLPKNERPGGLIGGQFCSIKKVENGLTSLEIYENSPIVGIFESVYSYYGNLQKILKNWEPRAGNDLAAANPMIVNIIQTEDELVRAIKDIQFVNTKLVASVVEGSAPLVVTFDVLNSQDPAGAIDPEKIEWDMLGNDKYDDNGDCYDVFGQSEEYTGFTNYCVYTTPGTYRVKAKITSGEETKYAPGISVVDIRVRPAETQIGLKATYDVVGTDGPEEPEWIMDYGQNNDDTTEGIEGFLRVSKNFIQITEEEAKTLVLDASRTEEFSGQSTTILNFKWDFGNGRSDQGPKLSSVKPEYKSPGVYPVTLEVTEMDGSSARKIFNVIVGSPAARAKMNPDTRKIYLGEKVQFDGSYSSTDGGKITNYKWDIKKIDGLCKDLAEGTMHEENWSDERITSYTFTEPGCYKALLRVDNSLGEDDSDSTQAFEVVSKPPVPLFEFKAPSKNKPSEVHFDGSKSYDPDADIGVQGEIKYFWSIEGDEGDPEKLIWVPDQFDAQDAASEFEKTKEDPVVLFKQEGEYKVTLRVCNDEECPSNPYEDDKIPSITKTITIDNTLDVDWADDVAIAGAVPADWADKSIGSTAQLTEGKADLVLGFISNNAVAYELNFGDGEKQTGPVQQGQVTIKDHTYTKAGKYSVKLTAYDEEDNYNEVVKNVFIGDGGQPMANIRILIDGEELFEFGEGSIIGDISRADFITFDASTSKNTDGTTRDLNYSWDFGDGEKSSKRTVLHRYGEFIPVGEKPYEVTLTVYDKDDQTIKSTPTTIKVDVIQQPPQFSSLEAIPAVGEDMITPTKVNMKLHGAKDPDGQINQYKWWYYDVTKTEEPLGIQITQVPTAQLVIGTSGEEGEEKIYQFGVEVTDNENMKAHSEEDTDSQEAQLDPAMIPEVTVNNGPNMMPTAEFSVDRTKVYAGKEESVNFSSSSKDKDGNIEEYIWDFTGNGFFDDEPTSQSTISHAYEEKNLDGYKVRLKVIDNEGAEAVSKSVIVYVDSNAEPPKAAFKSAVVSGKTVQFTNNSTADTSADAELRKYIWDFDTSSQFATADSDGDGDSSNDEQSVQKDPIFTYDEFGVYQVKLTVKDDKGNTTEITNMVRIDPPPTVIGAAGGANGGSTFTGGNLDDPYTQPGDLPTGDLPTDGGLFGISPKTDTPSEGGLDSNPGDADPGTLTPNTGANGLQAVLVSTPAPAADGIIYLTGEEAYVTFDLSQSKGSVAEYTIDKNIYHDLDGDGIKNNDIHLNTVFGGEYTTNFESAWGKTVLKLTVTDANGNQHSTFQEISFK